MPSIIAPLRLARAFHRCGHEVVGIQGEHEWFDGNQQQLEPWGVCLTGPTDNVVNTTKNVAKEFNPDLIFVCGDPYNHAFPPIAKEFGALSSLYVPDPYYQYFPNAATIQTYEQYDLIFASEGHASNYLRAHSNILSEKTYELNHAYDPQLGPSDEYLKESEKKYLASICAGLEVRRHGELIRMFYLPSLSFPDHFIVAGSLGDRFPNHIMSDENSSCTQQEIDKYSDFKFNVKCLSEPLKKPLSGSKAGVVHWDELSNKYIPWHGGGLSHRNVHKMYADSYVGFNPFGSYLYASEYGYKTYGTKLTEMMGSSAAVLCNNIPGIGHYIDDWKTGWVIPNDIPPGEQTNLATDRYQYAVDNPEEVIKMGINARNFILKNHTWDHRIHDIENLVS